MTNTITITLDAPTVECTVGGKVTQVKLGDIHAAAAAKIFAYGFQRFVNDKTGGKDAEEKAAIVLATMEAIKSGDIGRATSTRDPLAKYRRNVIRPHAAKQQSYKDAEDRNKYLDALYAKAAPEMVAQIDAAAAKLKAIDDKARAETESLGINIQF